MKKCPGFKYLVILRIYSCFRIPDLCGKMQMCSLSWSVHCSSHRSTSRSGTMPATAPGLLFGLG